MQRLVILVFRSLFIGIDVDPIRRRQSVRKQSTIWRITQPASTTLFQIDVRSKTTGQVVTVAWGDNSSNTYTLSATVDTAITHTYASGAVYSISIAGAQNIVRLTSFYADGRSNWGAGISTWRSLTYLDIRGSNTLSGSVAALTGLTYLLVQGSNTLSGSVAGLTGLTYLLVWGSNTLSGSVAGLTGLATLSVAGYNTLTGSVATLTGLTSLYVTGSNTLTWAVGPLTHLVTLSCADNALPQATVDAILLAMYTARANYLAATLTTTLGGTNQTPSGLYQDTTPPITGKEMAYKLVVDPQSDHTTNFVITYTA
jgi:hypothetical protein